MHTTRRGQTNALLFFPTLLMRFVKELNLNIDNFFEYKLIVRKKYHLWIRELIEYNKNKIRGHLFALFESYAPRCPQSR